jgi:hypothetical protein
MTLPITQAEMLSIPDPGGEPILCQCDLANNAAYAAACELTTNWEAALREYTGDLSREAYFLHLLRDVDRAMAYLVWWKNELRKTTY